MIGRHARRLGLIGALVAAGALAAPRGAASQSLDLTTPAPQQEPRERVRSQPPDRSVSPGTPAFVGPLSRETSDGRAGVAGWVSPNVPTGARGTTEPSGSGWLGIGFAIEWGASVTPPHRAEGAARN